MLCNPICCMPKAELCWIITRIRGTVSSRVGVVKAADADKAIKAAVRYD